MSVQGLGNTRQALYKALLAFQADAPTLQKDAINPHFKNKYVSLDSLTQTITPMLCKQELVWMTMPCIADGQPALGYRLVHAPTGEAIEGTMPLMLSKQDPQGQGSALTYARRYAISAVLGLSAEDDDGNGGSDRQNNSKRSQQPTATKEDIEALVASAKGLKAQQVRMGFAACGIEAPRQVDKDVFRGVPQSKTAVLAECLSEMERES